MRNEGRGLWRRKPAQGTAELVIAANRLPVEHDEEEGWRRAPGGLVTAMEAVLREQPATWVGWSGQFADADPAPPQVPDRNGEIELVELALTRAQVEAHYNGFSNGALWPNYHGGIVSPVYHRSQFEAHREINAMFAQAIAAQAGPGARVWVHDYQLQLVPAMLRTLRPDLRIGFFLHIPFPPVETFGQLPWRSQIVTGLLGADVIGFQTTGAVGNFLRAVGRYSRAEVIGAGGGAGGDDASGEVRVPEEPHRPVQVRAFPIGIRASDYAELAERPDVQARAAEIRADVGDPDVVLLGVDRLDYTKGIDVRLQAVTELMLDDQLDPESTAFVQVASPTRGGVEEYQKIRAEVELLVSRANGELGKVGTNPIHYMHQPMPPHEVVALYLAADVMLVTPLCDGMNLVAKEYVASRADDTGALVLSEFTGAAEQMTEAWLVNPYDIAGMKRSILAALSEPESLARARMIALRAGVFGEDVAAWARDFLAALPEEVAGAPEPASPGRR